MSRHSMTATILMTSLLAITGCKPSSAPAPAKTASTPSAAAEPASGAAGETTADVVVLSEEDAEIVAETEITADNADDEFARLQAEVEREAGAKQP